MNNYGVMNEEQLHQIRSNEHCSISSVEQINPSSDRLSLSVCIKVTDSDIRTIQINPENDLVGSLKHKVIFHKAFPSEIAENCRIRLIYNGRIMLDTQSLSIYSKIQ